jgi:hypothetical protein
MPGASRDVTPGNPHRGLHRAVFVAAALCLVIQVIEGALFVPFVLVYLGFPKVGLHEICRELYNITYQDDDRECRYPYPLFFRDFTPEPDTQERKEHVFGPVTPPRPRYDVPGWREMISIVEERRAAEASQAGVGHE